ncbi:hypothetical protein ABOM_008892 [Aspergillus bombycis]|uniref:HNH nuclease domain-containing protein n=1 Tax=Aspergillus bombycis TaxID=109264 RepID=A0A1F7ZPZ9_9EURO|nr:hypothetical protein ABOM_008892 [Aspergillus bombycis]OGM41522.1 hypothetical protein ABOM_008892 [Aspergillus bombycis]
MSPPISQTYPFPQPTPPLAVESEYWNERCEIRTDLLKKLRDLCREKLGRDRFPPTFWAFCQVADLTKLQDMIDDLRSACNTRSAQQILEPTIKDSDVCVDRWLQNVSVTKSSKSGTDHSGRSDTACNNCKKRDEYKCILTGIPDPEAAHIYPSRLLKASTREPRAVGRFWDILNVFWDENRVQRWKAEISGNPNDMQESKHGCFNMLCLDKYAHTLWGNGLFALRPMEITNDRTLKVQFYWQRGLSDALTEIDLLTEPESSRGLFGAKNHSLPRFTGKVMDNREPEYRAIASGDIFTLNTNNPRDMPLPSLALLEIQWNLQRVAGMSGAAELNSISDSDDRDADTTSAVELTRRIYEWLGLFTHSDEGFAVQQPPIEVRSMMQS